VVTRADGNLGAPQVFAKLKEYIMVPESGGFPGYARHAKIPGHKNYQGY
jgi:hypothetical protein